MSDSSKAILQLAQLLALPEHAEGKKHIDRSDILRKIDWEKVVAVANGQLLTPALYWAMREQKLFALVGDPLLEGFLKTVYAANEKRNLGILRQIDDIQNCLAKEGIAPLILKGGAALTESLYPALGVRMMNDLDLMIPPDRFDDALAALKADGYRAFGRVFERWHHHSARMEKEGFPAAIEPHFRVIYNRDIDMIPYNENTVTTSRSSKFSNCRVLRPTWHLYHIFLHSEIVDKNHRRWRLALRYLYDFSVAAHRYGNEVEWEVLYDLAKRYRHHEALEDFLYMGSKLFGLKTPIKFSRGRGAWHLKKCLWESTLLPETTLHKFYEAYVDFPDIYGYDTLKRYYGFRFPLQYPFYLVKYFLYHGKKHLLNRRNHDR